MKTEVLGRIHAKVLKKTNFAPDLPGHQAKKPGMWTLDQIVRHSFNQKEGIHAKSLQSCPTLCNPIDGSPPGFPVPGILQARTLEWVAIAFSKRRERKI